MERNTSDRDFPTHTNNLPEVTPSPPSLSKHVYETNGVVTICIQIYRMEHKVLHLIVIPHTIPCTSNLPEVIPSPLLPLSRQDYQTNAPYSTRAKPSPQNPKAVVPRNANGMNVKITY